ncbi:MAG: tRNA (adenosine(37)-N6)-threonylcarbamoyltransferase complex dimerization subunit type 1 TsaB [Lachnospiraceae bacterium]|nr:tRNA (adenosine(37)-N6)-threonylcarbamoyltransferase complex dimerization subunit type 1 TsaB [Lachnospiraceae bacterium]
MKLIALDSSGLVASVAVMDGGRVIAEYTTDYKKTHSQTLLPMLDAVSGMTDLDLSEIDAVAVAAGPGSFTGLRIGSATAKGLGLALGKPIVEVSTLAGLAFNLPFAEGLVCPIMDARRSQVYSGIYRFENGRPVPVREDRAIPVEELARELNGLGETAVFLGDGVDVYREMLEELVEVPHRYAPVHLLRQRASSVGALALIYAAEGRTVEARDHAPVYLRKSQAERERERALAGERRES